MNQILANPLAGQNKSDNIIRNSVGGVGVIRPAADGTLAAPTKTLVAADSGSIFFVDISTYTVYVMLPSVGVSDGFRVKLILHVDSNDEGTKDLHIVTASDAEDMQGSFFEDQDALTEVTGNTSQLTFDTSDGAATSGDFVEFIAFDGNWYVYGVVNTTIAIDIADGRS